MTQIIAVSGYPGSGKSSVCNMIKNRNITCVSMSDLLRLKFQRSNNINESNKRKSKSESLGQWVTEQRKQHGSDVVSNLTVEYIKNNVDDELVCVDGIRSDLHTFEQEFEDVNLIFVEASIETRLTRIRNRERDGEGNFKKEDLIKRDRREVEWGLDKMRFQSDFIVKNEGSMSKLESEVESILESIV